MGDIIVTIETGQISGKVHRNYHGGSFYTFSGIPYAKAPIGELRFKAPQPCEPWTGIKDGTTEGPECPSKDIILGLHNGNEDNCLNLNVYTRKLASPGEQVRNPVMVFIHGGGFVGGSNKSVTAGPQYLMTEDIVLVVINYRLGVFGFLSLEDPSLEVPGNAGLKDQVFALKWIQRNIHHFGGDPNNVTIFGESAGSASVHYLTLSPLSKGLFHKAIMQSGSALNIWARGRRNALDIAEAMGYEDTDEKIILEKLRGATAKSIVNGSFKNGNSFDPCRIRPFGPVIEYPHDGAFLTEDPIEIIKSGRSHQVPMIIGYTSLEGMFCKFVRMADNCDPLPSLEIEIPYDLNISQNRQLVEEVAKKIKDFYYGDAEISEENIRIRYLLFGDILMVHGIQKAARLLRQHGTAPIYLYRMSLESSMNFSKQLCETNYLKTFLLMSVLSKLAPSFLSRIMRNIMNRIPACRVDGASHGDELFYLFKLWISPMVVAGSEEDRHIQKFVKSWTNFARYGNPTPEMEHVLDNITWKPVESDQLDNIFDIDRSITITRNWENERVAFWDSIYQQYRGCE